MTYTNDTDVTKHLSTANTDISHILKGLRLSNTKNVILSYLSVSFHLSIYLTLAK